jgi:hypothetical protein
MRGSASDRADELGDEIVFDAFFAAFGTIAALFDPSERQLGDNDVEVMSASELPRAA